jgi:ABC-2 type transport system permease protein
MKVAVIALTNLRRMLRDRTNVFFVFILPLVLILVLGAVFGGFQPRLGIVVQDDGPLAAALADELTALPDVDVRRFGELDVAIDRLRRDELDGLVVIPAGFDRALRAGEPVEIRFAATPDEGFALRGLIQGPVASQAASIGAARVAVEARQGDLDTALAVAASVQERQIAVVTVTADDRPYEADLGAIDQNAYQQLVLFVFITGLTAAVALIQTRQLGVSRRMLATPTGVGQIILGEASGRWFVTLLQGVFLAVATAVLFGVDWGSWIGSGAVILAFSLVAAGAAMLVGALFTNESQASGIAIALSLGLAALGGSMVPLEVFPDTVRTVAYVTPHAWANDAFDALVRGGEPAGAVASQVLVLLAYAAVLFGIATLLLRRSLTNGS